MLDMQIAVSTDAGGFQRPMSRESTANSSNPFAQIIQSMVNAMEENGEENVDLSLLFNTDETNLFATDEEVDYQKLMELLAGFAENSGIVDFSLLNSQEDGSEILLSNLKTLATELVSAGIDISELTPEDGKQLFEFFQAMGNEEKPELSFEFGKVESSDNDAEADMNLLNSFASKNFEIRNVADESDSENEVFNLAVAQFENQGIIREMPTTIQPVNPEIFNQVSDAIVENAEQLELGEGEFVMKLNPEELGEVTIKLVNEDGKSTLQITAASQAASRLINSDLNVLREVFRPMEIEVRDAEIAVAETQGSQMQGFDMQQQSFNQNGNNFNQEGFVSYGNSNAVDEEIVEEVQTQVDDPNNLNILV